MKYPSRTHRSHHLVALGLFVVVGALIAVSAYLSGSVNPGPRVDSVEPTAALPGDVVVIEGAHFGNTRGLSAVRVGNHAFTESGYRLWSDTRIEVVVPEQFGAGLLRVVTDAGRSAAFFFTNQARLPALVGDAAPGGRPEVFGSTPINPAPGQVLTLRGREFGSHRGERSVSFAAAGGRVTVSPMDGGYAYWSDNEVRVRVPFGAVGGSLVVHTPAGASEPVPVQIDGAVGTFGVGESRHIALVYGANVTHAVHQTAVTDETSEIALWMPAVGEHPGQRAVQILRATVSPVLVADSGPTLYSVPATTVIEAAGRPVAVMNSLMVRRYTLHTTVVADRVPPTYPAGSFEVLHYLAPDARVPADDPAVTRLVARFADRRNPYLRARAIYDAVVESIDLPDDAEVAAAATAAAATTPAAATAAAATAAATTTTAPDPAGIASPALSSAVLLTAAWRAGGVPARVISGYLVIDEQRLVPHFWSEFFVADFGWVPADPFLAAGAYPAQGFAPTARRDFYFGNLDNARVTLLVGTVDPPRLTPTSRVGVAPVYPMQLWHQEHIGSDLPWRVDWLEPVLIETRVHSGPTHINHEIGCWAISVSQLNMSRSR